MIENEEFYDEEMYSESSEVPNGVRVLTDAEARAIFDEQAQRRLNMSGEEFIRKWDAGEFDDDPERVMGLVMLIPLVR